MKEKAPQRSKPRRESARNAKGRERAASATIVPRGSVAVVCAVAIVASIAGILNAFTQVRTSFQYLVNSWSTIVELISIYQRLRGFEAKIGGGPLPTIETRSEPVTL